MNALSTLCPCSVHALLGDHKALLVWISSNPGGGGATPYSGVLGVVRENLGFSEKKWYFLGVQNKRDVFLVFRLMFLVFFRGIFELQGYFLAFGYFLGYILEVSDDHP